MARRAFAREREVGESRPAGEVEAAGDPTFVSPVVLGCADTRFFVMLSADFSFLVGRFFSYWTTSVGILAIAGYEFLEPSSLSRAVS